MLRHHEAGCFLHSHRAFFATALALLTPCNTATTCTSSLERISGCELNVEKVERTPAQCTNGTAAECCQGPAQHQAKRLDPPVHTPMQSKVEHVRANPELDASNMQAASLRNAHSTESTHRVLGFGCTRELMQGRNQCTSFREAACTLRAYSARSSSCRSVDDWNDAVWTLYSDCEYSDPSPTSKWVTLFAISGTGDDIPAQHTVVKTLLESSPVPDVNYLLTNNDHGA